MVEAIPGETFTSSLNVGQSSFILKLFCHENLVQYRKNLKEWRRPVREKFMNTGYIWIGVQFVTLLYMKRVDSFTQNVAGVIKIA
jgi:hypothetical protein